MGECIKCGQAIPEVGVCSDCLFTASARASTEVIQDCNNCAHGGDSMRDETCLPCVRYEGDRSDNWEVDG